MAKKKGMKLIAGDKGIDRTIRWIYFADCVQCLSADFNVAELIHGEELVIITNESLTENDSRLIDMIRVMQEKNIAALRTNARSRFMCFPLFIRFYMRMAWGG